MKTPFVPMKRGLAHAAFAVCTLAASVACKAQRLDSALREDEPLRDDTRASIQERPCFFADLIAVHDVMINDDGGIPQLVDDMGYASLKTMDPNEGKTSRLDRHPSKGYAFLSKGKDAVVVAFRGTNSLVDGIHDIAAVPSLDASVGLVHLGFDRAASLYAGPAAQAIADLMKEAAPKVPKVTITGHSLGGAIATVIVKKLRDAGVKVDELIVFGTPRVGLRFRQLFDPLRVPLVHYYTKGDPVPALPTPPFEDLPGGSAMLVVPGTEDETGFTRAQGLANDLASAGAALATFDLSGVQQIGEASWQREISRHFPHVYRGLINETCDATGQRSKEEQLVRRVHRELFGRELNGDDLAAKLADFRRGGKGEEGYKLAVMLAEEYRRHFVVQYLKRDFPDEKLEPREIDGLVEGIKEPLDFAKVAERIEKLPRVAGLRFRDWLVKFGIDDPFPDAELSAWGEKVIGHTPPLQYWQLRTVTRQRADGTLFRGVYSSREISEPAATTLVYGDRDFVDKWIRGKQDGLRRRYKALDETQKAREDQAIRSILFAVRDKESKKPVAVRGFYHALCAILQSVDAFEATIDRAYAFHGKTPSDADRAALLRELPLTELKGPVPVDGAILTDDGADDGVAIQSNGGAAEFASKARPLFFMSAVRLDATCEKVTQLHAQMEGAVRNRIEAR